MTAKTPIRTVFDGSTATGLAEFQSGEFIGLTHGGLGASLTIGSAGQVLKVNSGGTAVEFGNVDDVLNIDGATDLTGATLATTDQILVSDSGTEGRVTLSQVDTLFTSTSQTLTNKTIDSASNTLTLDLGEGTLTGTTAEFNTALQDGSFATLAGTEALTNKTIALGSNTVSGTLAQFQTAVTDATLVDLDDAQTLTNKTISGSSNTLSNIGNSSLTNSTITVTDGSTSTATSLGGTITFSGTSNEIEVGESSGTITVGLPNDVVVGNNLTVTGNLTVSGTTTTVDTTNTVVSDTLLELANGTTGTPSNDAGIVIERGDSNNAFMGFDESADKFIVGTGTFTGASTGNLTITTGTMVANVEGNVTGNVTGNADTATALSSAVTVELTGDVTGSATFTSAGDTASIATTVAANSVALGTDTTGNYVADITAGNLIDVSGGGAETATVTVDVDLSELTTSTSDGDGDFFVVVDDANAQKKLTKGNINISGFNNDAGYSTTTGTVTSITVSAGNGLTGGATVTASGTATLNVGAGTGVTVAADTVSIGQAVGTGDTPTFAGMNLTADLDMEDNDKILLGTGDDLQIYHDGTNSYISDSGTGDLFIRGENDIWFQIADGTETYARFKQNDGVELNFDNSKKFETTTGGIAVTGAITATGDVTAFYTSDETLKTNIETIENPMDKVKEIKGISYNWTPEALEKYDHLTDNKEVGVIAQDVEKVLPEMVAEREDGTKAVRYERMCALLIECVKDLQNQIDELKK